MVQTVEFDLKQAVLVNGPSARGKSGRCRRPSPATSPNYAVLRDAVGELQAKEEPDARPAGSGWASACTCWAATIGRSRSSSRPTAGPWPTSTWPSAISPGRSTTRPLESYQAAEKAGYDAGECALGRAEALRYAGDAARRAGRPRLALRRRSSRRPSTSPSAPPPWPPWAAIRSEVVALYERAVEVDRNHPGALFGLALENDRHGNDDTAMELYKRAAGRFPAHVGSLMNLGLLYEDREQYDKAAQCYQRVLDVYPDHRPGGAVLQGHRSLARAVLRRRRARRSATG